MTSKHMQLIIVSSTLTPVLAHTHIHTHKGMNTRVHAHRHPHTQPCTHTCTHAHAHAHAHTHTHTHTHTHAALQGEGNGCRPWQIIPNDPSIVLFFFSYALGIIENNGLV